jgi:hypothetical protein
MRAVKKMSHATVKLLRAAAEILGSEEALARHLDIGTLLLGAYMEERRPLPDYLLLRAVDVVLENMAPPAVVPAQAPHGAPRPARSPTSSD